MRALLDHLQPLGLQVVAARRRQAQLAARGEHDPALTPRVGVNHQRQSRAPPPTDQSLETAVVVGMAMRDDDRAQVAHRHLEHVEVARHRIGREPSVVEHSMTITVALEGDHGREAVLGDQLLRRSEVPRPIANHALLARHQHVEEVVDHHRDLDAINGSEHETIVRLVNVSP